MSKQNSYTEEREEEPGHSEERAGQNSRVVEWAKEWEGIMPWTCLSDQNAAPVGYLKDRDANFSRYGALIKSLRRGHGYQRKMLLWED